MTEGPVVEPLLRVPDAAGRGYPVYVGRGLFGRLGELVAREAPAYRHVVVSDDRVAGLYGASAVDALTEAGLSVELLTFPAGEARKTRDTWADLTDRMLEAGAGRDTVVVALGGGVTGDLAGFVASTYMRGVPLVAVPTSLLAMLDSSIGGKTGVDTAAAKNVVGSFHHPRLVIVDPDLLVTLPVAHRAAGLAEAIKIAAVRDAAAFEWIEANAPSLAEGDAGALGQLVEAGLRLKADVVAGDPLESGLRQVLNFGHTAGHALEALAGFTVPHGAAVAAGMRLEARLGEATATTECGTAERLDAVLAACGVPDLLSEGMATGFGGPLTGGRILDAAVVDKKARGGHVRWVLPARIGRVARDPEGGWSHALPAPETIARLDDALRAIADVRDSAS